MNIIYLETMRATVAPRYNKPQHSKDPVIMNNISKPGRITVKYVETNPAITKSPLYQIDFDGPNAQFSRYTEYFVLSLTLGKHDMMIQMADKPNMTPIGQGRETLTFKALLYLTVSVHAQVCRLF